MPSLALGTGLVTPLDLDRRLRGVSQRRQRRRAARASCASSTMPAASRCEESDDPRRVPCPRRRVPDGLADDATSSIAAPAPPVRAWGVRFPVAGKTGTTNDFKDAWFVGYSTPWSSASGWGSISRRRFGRRLRERAWRCRSGPTSCAGRAAWSGPARSRRPTGMRAVELCRVSYLRPVDGCPIYTEYFKAGDAVPSAHCQIHSGNLARRARTRDRTRRGRPARQAVVEDQGTVTESSDGARV